MPREPTRKQRGRLTVSRAGASGRPAPSPPRLQPDLTAAHPALARLRLRGLRGRCRRPGLRACPRRTLGRCPPAALAPPSRARPRRCSPPPPPPNRPSACSASESARGAPAARPKSRQARPRQGVPLRPPRPPRPPRRERHTPCSEARRCTPRALRRGAPRRLREGSLEGC